MEKIFIYMVAAFLLLASCKSMNRTQKGAVIGAAGGGAAGAAIGKATGNTKLGAIIGASVGGAAGAIIGRKMDKQAEEIEKKIPDAKVERVGEGIVVEFNNEILFGFNSAELSMASKNSLRQLAAVLSDYPDTDVEIQGHTDSKGSDSYNQDLSVKRAAVVRDFLALQNVDRRRMNIVGYGELAPEYDNSTVEGRALNRRVEFLITANEKMKQEAERESSSK